MVFPIDRIPADAYVYGMIFTLANRMQSVGDKRDDEVTTMQCFMLANLMLFEDYQLNLGQMAELLGTSRQSTRKMADLLMKKGYLDLQKDREDARNIRISLTEKGKRYYSEREKQESRYLDQLFDGFEDDLLEKMKEGLTKLFENVTSYEKSRSEKEK